MENMRKLVGILLIALAACGGDKTTGPNDITFAGTFTLRTVNGQNLPYVILQSGQNSITFISDQITVADGGTWTENGSLRVVSNGQTTSQVYADGGTWIRSGNSISFVSNDGTGAAYNGTFTSAQLTLTDNLFNYVFAR